MALKRRLLRDSTVEDDLKATSTETKLVISDWDQSDDFLKLEPATSGDRPARDGACGHFP